MAAAKKAAGDAGQDEVKSTLDEAREKGYVGSTPDENENEAYSLETGPDSPGVEKKG